MKLTTIYIIAIFHLIALKSQYVYGKQSKPGSLVSSYTSYKISSPSQERSQDPGFFSNLFNTGTNVIDGLPFQYGLDLYNNYCTSVVAKDSVHPAHIPNISKVPFVLMTPTTNYTIPLTKAYELWENKEFNRNIQTVFVATGWTTNLETTDGALDALFYAYMCRGDVNFVAIDTSHYLDTYYSWSAVDTKTIGNYVGTGLKQLVSSGYSIDKIHLIGHSLGAQIVGFAGKNFTQQTGKQLPRITGLDPAKPCFNVGTGLSGLQKTDAKFVDIIHTDPGVLAVKEAIGDADFYPNGKYPIQPGCLSVWCSHSRSWEYYAESVYPGNSYGFPSVKCQSIDDLDEGYCSGDAYPMGWACPTDLNGILYLNTNSKVPYGLDSKQPSDIVCSKYNANDTDIKY